MKIKISITQLLTSLFLCLLLAFLASCYVPNQSGIIASCKASEEHMPADKAIPTVHFNKNNPASVKPVLTWTSVKGAVAYELELSDTSSENSQEFTPTSTYFYSTKEVYVNGFNADLSQYSPGKYFYWHVRGLDIEGNPLSDFSDAEKVYIDYNQEVVSKPIPTSTFNQGNGTILLYPVYDWILVNQAKKYEIEILDDLPENPNGIEPSIHRIDTAISTGGEYYDETPRISENPFYWRVRGLDNNDNPIGVYSDAKEFVVNPKERITVGTFGDSITHGGGGISYSPSNWEYSYQYYLDFPSINLGKSGDTSQTMVARFEDDVLPFHPQYLIILAGTNSLRGGTPASDVIANLKTIKEKCLSNNIRPVFLTLPPINPDNIKRAFDEDTAPDWQKQINTVNKFIRTQIHIDIAPLLKDENGILPTEFGLDGLHLDIDGKKIMADTINENWPRIKSLTWQTWLESFIDSIKNRF